MHDLLSAVLASLTLFVLVCFWFCCQCIADKDYQQFFIWLILLTVCGLWLWAFACFALSAEVLYGN